MKKDVPEWSLAEIKNKAVLKEPFYIFTDRAKLKELQSSGVETNIINAVAHFHVSTLKLKFINPSTRSVSLDSLWLLKIN